jgi:hypothetical protein
MIHLMMPLCFQPYPWSNRRMKLIVVRIFVILSITFQLSGCGSNKNAKPATDPIASNEMALPEPTKEILVTEGDINKKYMILGEIKYKSDKGSSVYSNQIEARKHAKENLKKAAFAKYGNKLDAIINTHVEAGMQGGFWGRSVQLTVHTH